MAARALPVLILLAAWALRVHALGAKSFWYDEMRQIEVAQAPINQFEPLLIQHAARPLDYFITHFTLQAAGPGDGPAERVEFWLRFPEAIWSLLALAAFLPLARRWLNRPAAWAAWGMLAAAPLAVQYGQELRPYSIYLLLSILSFYHLDCALGLGPRPARRSRLHWVAFALVSAAGTLTHFFYTFLLLAQALFVAGLFAVDWLRARRPPGPARQLSTRQLLAFTAGAAAGVLALFIDFSPEHLGLYVTDFIGALTQAPVTGGVIVDTGIGLQNSDALNTDFFFRGLFPFFGGGEGPALVLFGVLVLLGLVVWARHSRSRLAQGASWLLLAPTLVIVYLQYRQQFFALRYILYMLPIYLMLAAAGLAAVAGAMGRRWPSVPIGGQWRVRPGAALYGVGLALLLIFQLQRLAFYYQQPKDDWRRVGEFLRLNTRPGDTLGAPDVQAFIRFYAPQQPAVIVDSNELGPHKEALANGERFWFVDSQYTLVPVGETQRWAETLPGVTIRLDPRIKIIFVDPSATPGQALAEAQNFVIPPPSMP